MATIQATADYLMDQMSGAGEVTSRKMFGEYAIYLNGKVVALLCDEQLFLKPTESGRALLRSVTEAPPYPGAKPHFLIEADLWEDRDFLASLLAKTAAELPAPKRKKPAR